MSNKTHIHNLAKLEDAFMTAYEAFLADSQNEKTRVDLFYAIYNLAFSILNVSIKYKKFVLDYKETAFSYAVSLFYRIVYKGFRFKHNGRIPIQKYIDINIIQQVHLNAANFKDPLFLDIANELDKKLLNEHCQNNDDRSFSTKLLDCLKVFYTEEEIKKYIVYVKEISKNIGQKNNNKILNMFCDEKLKCFFLDYYACYAECVKNSRTLKATARLNADQKMPVAKIKSSILLSHILLNSDLISKELTAALDLDAIYRLAEVAGGKTIDVPQLEVVEKVLDSIESIDTAIQNGAPVEVVINETVCKKPLFDNHIVKDELRRLLIAVQDATETKEQKKKTDEAVTITLIHALLFSLDDAVAKLQQTKLTQEARLMLQKRLLNTLKTLYVSINKE